MREDDFEADFDDAWEDYKHELMHGPAQEEPDCPGCNDQGGRCCHPTRLDRWISRLRWRLHSWRQRHRGTDPLSPDEPPF